MVMTTDSKVPRLLAVVDAELSPWNLEGTQVASIQPAKQASVG